MKNLIASIYFGKNKTYLAILERTPAIFVLHYLNTTVSSMDLNDLNSEKSVENFTELSTMIMDYCDNITKLFITIDVEDAFLTMFPGDIDDDTDSLLELLKLEVRQNFSDLELSDFKTKIADALAPNENKMLTAALIPNKIVIACEQIASNFGLEVTDININKLAMFNAFLYNYPEDKNENNLIISINADVVEFCMIASNKVANYDVTVDFKNISLPELIENKANQMMFAASIDNFKNIFIVGSTLDKSVFFECWEIGALLGSETKRLNPLRLFKTTLAKRERAYCARVFHLYSYCIGGALPLMFRYRTL